MPRYEVEIIGRPIVYRVEIVEAVSAKMAHDECKHRAYNQEYADFDFNWKINSLVPFEGMSFGVKSLPAKDENK